jgi:hypothetical protein
MTNKPATTPSSYATLPTGVTMFFRRNEDFWMDGSIGMGDYGRSEMIRPTRDYSFWRVDEERYQKFLALPLLERISKGFEKKHQHSRETLREWCDFHKDSNKEFVDDLRKSFCRINQEVVDGFSAIFPLAAELAKIDLYEVMGVGIGDAPKTDPVTYYDIKYDSRIALAAPVLNGYAYYAHPLDDSHDYAKKLELLTEYCAAMKDPKDLLYPYVTEMYHGLDKEQRSLAIQARDVLVGCRNLIVFGNNLMRPYVGRSLNNYIPEIMVAPLNDFKDKQLLQRFVDVQILASGAPNLV